MRSLLKQLCSDSANEPIRDPVASTFKQRQEVAESRGQEIEPLSLEESTSQIIDVLSLRQDPAFIILDALDECNVDSVHDLLDALERILQEAAGLTKIFLTSRDDGDIRNRLEGITNVYIDASNNSDDINRFIDAEVDKAISRRRLLGGRVSTSLKDEILTTLKDKAGGMYASQHLPHAQSYANIFIKGFVGSVFSYNTSATRGSLRFPRPSGTSLGNFQLRSRSPMV